MERIEEGVVRRVNPRVARVRVGDEEVDAHVRGSLKEGPRDAVHVVAVGDRVVVRRPGDGTALLERVLPRRNVISRVDPGDRLQRRRHDLAANLDRICLVVSTAFPRFNPRAVDRFLVLAEVSGVPPLLVLNKCDLERARDAPVATEELPAYARLGYPVLATSAATGEGIDGLRHELAGRVTLLAGPSGVGKSTLLNVAFGLSLRVGAVSRATAKGVHTTTRVDWVDLPGGGVVLDSPGIRSIHPWGLGRRGLAGCFPEIRELAPCRFGDCLHQGEAGCEVAAAVERGEVAPARWESYVRILETLA